MPRLHLVADVTMKNRYRASWSGQSMPKYWKSLLQCLVSVVKFIAERGLTFRDYENVGSPKNFFQAKFQKKEVRHFWCPALQQFYTSLIIANYHAAS